MSSSLSLSLIIPATIVTAVALAAPPVPPPPPPPAQPSNYGDDGNNNGNVSGRLPSALVVFGDSFSDNGNGSYRITNHTWPADPAYYKGHFSNGPVWCENVAANLSIPLYDYAIGGSTTSNALVQGYTGPKSTVPVPALDQQLRSFLNSQGPTTDFGATLFTLFSGANDILFNPNLTASRSAAIISDSLELLASRGANNFLLLNYPDLSQIPYDSFIDVTQQRQLHEYSVGLGRELRKIERVAEEGHRRGKGGRAVRVTFVDLKPLFASFEYYGQPAQYGFDKFGSYGSCLTGAYMETVKRTLCTDPEQRVFWDEYQIDPEMRESTCR